VYNSKSSFRFSLVFFVIILSLGYLSVRLILIQVFRSNYLADLAQKQHDHFILLEPKRGNIFDRKLRPLAFNVPAYSLYAQPKMMTLADKNEALRKLPSLLGLNPNLVKERLNRPKYFVWLARKLSLPQVQMIRQWKIKGLDFLQESRRSYPNEFLAAHLVGFAGIDNQGLEGIELVYDKYLKGKSGWSKILRDARQQELLIEKNFIPPQNGFDLILTIDETIQYLAERAVDKAFKKHNARGAILILMNPKTGEILALVNRPTYDLANPSRYSTDSRRNRAINDMYEPGSIFKIVTATAALEEGGMNENDKFFCENGSYKVANHILHDHTPHGTLTFSEVFEQSSNIGVTKIAQKLGPAMIYKYARLFRFGIPTGIELVGETGGVLKPPSQWSKTSIGAIPIGQEVTVTALQMVCAMSVIANEGIYMKPYVVKYIQDQEGEIIEEFHPQQEGQVMKPETALRVKNILTKVVAKGTGRMAMIDNVLVAGKTGTAQKVENGTYSHSKFYASFVGFAPVEDPKIAMVVVFDEPHGTHYGGTVAAPVFKEVAQDVLKYLNTNQ